MAATAGPRKSIAGMARSYGVVKAPTARSPDAIRGGFNGLHRSRIASGLPVLNVTGRRVYGLQPTISTPAGCYSACSLA